MKAVKRTKPSKAAQIDRALSLLDRILALIENETEPAEPPAVSPEIAARISSRAPCWRDKAVREALLALYGRGSTREAADLLIAQFGPKRAPSKSALARIYAVIASAQLAK